MIINTATLGSVYAAAGSFKLGLSQGFLALAKLRNGLIFKLSLAGSIPIFTEVFCGGKI